MGKFKLDFSNIFKRTMHNVVYFLEYKSSKTNRKLSLKIPKGEIEGQYKCQREKT